MLSGRTNNFPQSSRGLGHVTPTIFGVRSNISPQLLELETSNLVCGFVWGMTSRRTNNFPRKWAWPWPLFKGRFRSSHRPAPRISVVTIWFSDYLCTLYIYSAFCCQCVSINSVFSVQFKPSECRHIILLWGSTAGYPSDSLASCPSITHTDGRYYEHWESFFRVLFRHPEPPAGSSLQGRAPGQGSVLKPAEADNFLHFRYWINKGYEIHIQTQNALSVIIT